MILLSLSLFLFLLGVCFRTAVASFNATAALATCNEISSAISGASEVIYLLNPEFTIAIEHWVWNSISSSHKAAVPHLYKTVLTEVQFLSSTQVPTCVLNAGSAEDVSLAIQIIGRDKTPFAIKSGGHATNPGFSSTQGVHIYPGRINQVALSEDGSIANIGLGQTWADVYQKLDGTGRGVNGGRVPGPGVGGFVLGGGYTWKTNQYGLTVDTVKSYTLVLPNGTISQIDSSQPDLFFALKGGFNQFGIVTSVEMFTHPQGEVYAGYKIYSGSHIEAIANATVAFDLQTTDPKAQIISTLEAGEIQATAFAIVLFFYDGPTKPAIFSLFDAIPSLTDEVKQQTFSSFISSIPSRYDPNFQGRFTTLSVTQLTAGLADLIVQEMNLAGSELLAHGGGPFPPSYELDPFTNFGRYATDSAFPHADSPKPINLYFSWLLEAEDAFWIDFMAASRARLVAYAQEHGIWSPLQYGNYAVANTTAEELFGAENAARLRRIRAELDPERVMDLCGGFQL